MAIINIPTNAGYGTVVGQFILAYGDSSDSGSEPDAIAASGSVIFTPSTGRIKDATASPNAVTILPAQVECQLDADGYILGYSGHQGVNLIATDDTDLNPVDWTWGVEFRLTDPAGDPVKVPGFSFELPQGTTVDLTVVSPVPDANGTYYTQGATGATGPEGPEGPEGPAGPPNTLTVGTVTSGTTPSATITGTSPDQVLNLVLAKGDKGDTGDTGAGVQAGGTTGQILAKASNTDYDTEWVATPPPTLTATSPVTWNSGTSTIAFDSVAFAKESNPLLDYVKNNTGGSVTKGQAVYISGADGSNALISLADADTELTSSKTLGLLYQDLAVNGLGWVVTNGMLSGIDTSAAGAAGDSVWLSSTAGGLVYGAPPAKPAHSVYLGVVTRKSATVGEILVKVQNGYELDELHDVDITGTPADNEVLAYDNASSMWINQTADEAGLLTPTSAVPTATNAAAASGFGFIGLPQVSTATGLSLTATHAGKHIYTTATGQTHTIPANGSVPLQIGTTIVFINQGAITTTIAITTDTLTLAGTTTTGSRTLGSNGMATAVKVGSTSWVISGNGLT